MGDLPARHDFGTIDVGSSAVLELPIENIGAMDLEGLSIIEGDAYFSVYPEYFQAGPARTDGVVISFTPGAEGDFEGMLVLQSNDPLGRHRDSVAGLCAVRHQRQHQRRNQQRWRSQCRHRSVWRFSGAAPDCAHANRWVQLLFLSCAKRPRGCIRVPVGRHRTAASSTF